MDWDSPVILGGNLAVHFTELDTFVITVGDRKFVETEVDSGALRVLSHFVASRTPRDVFAAVASADITVEVFEASLEQFMANGVLVPEAHLIAAAVATESGSETACEALDESGPRSVRFSDRSKHQSADDTFTDLVNRGYFRVLAPFSAPDDVDILRAAGADELYCGYTPPEAEAHWPTALFTLNRRGEGASFKSFESFREGTGRAHSLGMPVFVTVNGLYTPEQYPLLLDLVDRISALEGVTGIIVADLAFILTLLDRGYTKEIHISTGGTCFNSASADFFTGLGAKRIVLPGHTTADEVRAIIGEASLSTDYEIFVTSNLTKGTCLFVDGFCTSLHCTERRLDVEGTDGLFKTRAYNHQRLRCVCVGVQTALEEDRYRIFRAKDGTEVANPRIYDEDLWETVGCNLCTLYDLTDQPIRALKATGREAFSAVAEVIELVSKARDFLAKERPSRADYLRHCQLLRYNYTGLGCNLDDCFFSPRWANHAKQD